MRICIVMTTKYVASPRCIRIALSLRKHWVVEVIDFRGQRQQETADQSTGDVKVVGLGARWWPKNDLVKFFVLFVKVFPAILKANADVYHCSGFPALAVAALIKVLTGKKLVYDCYEHYPYQFASAPSSKMTLRQSIVWNTILCFEDALARLCDFILVVPTYDDILLKRFEKVRKNKTTLIWNLPFLALLDKTIGSKNIRKNKTILHVGGISKNSGADRLLRAISKLVVDFPAIQVLMVGSSDIAEELAHLAKRLGIEQQFKILKPVSFFEIWKIYNDADISVVLYQPTFWNLRTMASEKLFESMLYSLPMIVSDFPGLRRIVSECQSGVLVDPTNPEDICRGLVSLLSDPSLSERMGKNGRLWVLRKYNWENEEKKLVGIYSRILSSVATSETA